MVRQSFWDISSSFLQLAAPLLHDLKKRLPGFFHGYSSKENNRVLTRTIQF